MPRGVAKQTRQCRDCNRTIRASNRTGLCAPCQKRAWPKANREKYLACKREAYRRFLAAHPHYHQQRYALQKQDPEARRRQLEWQRAYDRRRRLQARDKKKALSADARNQRQAYYHKVLTRLEALQKIARAELSQALACAHCHCLGLFGTVCALCQQRQQRLRERICRLAIRVLHYQELMEQLS